MRTEEEKIAFVCWAQQQESSKAEKQLRVMSWSYTFHHTPYTLDKIHIDHTHLIK